ncbi:MAG: hypothetical protein M3046_04085 [Actinomycetota bacterium]|nr:hypothetical protein [Actinomycetota bacterium]
MDFVEWYCPTHGVVTAHPDDGGDRRNFEGRSTEKPIPPMSCPGPWDEERGQWLYECGAELRRRVIPD